jgi:amino acid permease
MKRKILLAVVSSFLLTLLVVVPAFAHENVGGDELAGADVMLVLALMFFTMTGLCIIFSVQNGELRNPEAIKYQMLQVASIDEQGQDLEEYVLVDED